MSQKMMKMMAPNGTYMKGNEEKTKWQQIGVLFIYEDGNMQAKMDCLPINGWDGKIMFFERDNYSQQPKQQQQQPAQSSNQQLFNDDVPF